MDARDVGRAAPVIRVGFEPHRVALCVRDESVRAAPYGGIEYLRSRAFGDNADRREVGGESYKKARARER